ncbi:hypothetical protein K402DRAFT_453317 [Aulographum hederae CBS 113979]|uniref:Ubiquitin 3 binding protein But2 C-terminal domain-containing protein n=1 Tax=Aulographum hederae CBS 113979 TaxID=1176131 RepID=A0A6G1H3J5_9PEZI|nr:hypothetical protein K402DRAFT_453317 [Aulographum hederae CBS 113979]
MQFLTTTAVATLLLSLPVSISAAVLPSGFSNLFPAAFPTGVFPTKLPSGFPTAFPTGFPTAFPTGYPTDFPSAFPTDFPSDWLPHKPSPTGLPMVPKKPTTLLTFFAQDNCTSGLPFNMPFIPPTSLTPAGLEKSNCTKFPIPMLSTNALLNLTDATQKLVLFEDDECTTEGLVLVNGGSGDGKGEGSEGGADGTCWSFNEDGDGEGETEAPTTTTTAMEAEGTARMVWWLKGSGKGKGKGRKEMKGWKAWSYVTSS